MHDAFLQNGYPTYRAPTMSMAGALDQNLVAKDVLASIKQSLDPQNLIAPGRYGTPQRDKH